MVRTILHLDLDAFFCSVEELHDPSLHGKAFAVGGRADRRGVISSCSYAARRFGVRSAMPTSRALRLCPDLMVISHHFGNYHEMSAKVMQRLRDLAPLVEQISIDEAFVEISDLHDPAEEIAHRLQHRVNDELNLPCSVGVASCKLVAKIATEVGKKQSINKEFPPNAVTVVSPGMEAAFLEPLTASMLWGVGPKTEARLAVHGIKTIGNIAHTPEDVLVSWFGSNGRDLFRHAHGLDDSPVTPGHEAKSISQETTFPRDVHDDKVLTDTLRELSAQVGLRLREAGISGSTVRIKLRWPDFSSLTRQMKLGQPTDQDEEIYHRAQELLARVREKGKAVRLIGVSVSNLGMPLRQLELWGSESEKSRRLQQALDTVRQRYGEKAIRRGRKNT